MKKILPTLISIFIVAIIAIIFISISKDNTPTTIVEGNEMMRALDIDLNHTNDTQCAMIINSIENVSQLVAPDGRTWFFDDPGCMVLWMKDKPFRDQTKLWVHTIDTKKWIDAREAHYGIADHTAMHYGFGAREHNISGTISFEDMYLKMLRGENLTNPKIRKKLLGI